MPVKKILLIEDEIIVIKLLKKKLQRENFKVIHAEDGKAGLEVALGQKPDLIVLDIVMPYMDGIEFLKLLRKDDWGKDVPVMMLTNLSDKYKIEQTQKLKAINFIIKANFELNAVVEKIKNNLT